MTRLTALTLTLAAALLTAGCSTLDGATPAPDTTAQPTTVTTDGPNPGAGEGSGITELTKDPAGITGDTAFAVADARQVHAVVSTLAGQLNWDGAVTALLSFTVPTEGPATVPVDLTVRLGEQTLTAPALLTPGSQLRATRITKDAVCIVIEHNGKTGKFDGTTASTGATCDPA